MKIKDGFVIRNVADTFVVVPVGDKLVDFSAMMTLNETGAFLWNCLAENITKEQLVEKMCGEYDVDEKTAAADITEFLDILDSKNILDR